MNVHEFLGREEDMIGEYTMSCSGGLAWLNYYFGITNKRLIVNEPRKLWIIPVGSNDETYSLSNISSVRFKKNINLKKAGIGALLLLFSFSDFSSLFLLGLVGIALLYASLEEKILIQNNSGRVTSYKISIFERSKAKQFVTQLNKAIADHL